MEVECVMRGWSVLYGGGIYCVEVVFDAWRCSALGGGGGGVCYVEMEMKCGIWQQRRRSNELCWN